MKTIAPMLWIIVLLAVWIVIQMLPGGRLPT